MSIPGSGPASSPPVEPMSAYIEAERRGWYEVVALVRSLTPEECLEPGYDQDQRTVRDIVVHLGTWLAEARVQLDRLGAGAYDYRPADLDATFLEGMAGQPWGVAWVQANAARSRMLEEWYALREPGGEAVWWIDKCAAEHLALHLGPLRDWTSALVARRGEEHDWGGPQPSG